MTTMLDPLYVSAAYRTPFDIDRRAQTMKFEPKLTLAQMVDTFPTLPPDFRARGEITIGDHVVPRDKWPMVRLKPGVAATFFYAPGGGGGEGGKRSKGGILALVIGIATILTAGAALAGSFMTGGLFLAGSTSAKLLAGAITVAGQLLAKAVSKPPTQKKADTGNDEQKGAASASGNLLEAGAPIPRVVGTMKVYPSLLAQPFTYRTNGDEVVEALFGLGGPHQWNKIKLGELDISGALDVQYQTREGWDDDAPIDMITRYAVTANPGLELSAHDVVGDDQQELRNQTVYTASLPIFHGAPAATSPDQINIDLTFLEGLYDTTDVDAYQRIALRFRMRNLDTGITYNLPELHYTSKTAREIRPTVILTWADVDDSPPSMPSNGWAAAYYTVPAQVSPPMGGWQADASFFGSGDTYLSRANQATSGLIRAYPTATDEFTFNLDVAFIPRGRYQVEVQRSTTVKDSNFSTSAYTLSGTVYDLFGYIFSGSKAMVVKKRVNTADRIALVRIASVFNRHPINGGLQGSGLAIIAVKATNRAVENLSSVASGYVQDWDGSDWNTWTVSSNPSTNFHSVLRGPLTPDIIDLALVDNDVLVDWRQDCIDKNYTVNMICEGDSLQDILEVTASCGYGRPRMSDMWGVIRDYDRSGDPPSQVFTAANSFGLTMENEFVRLPDALRVVYTDSAADYATGEAIVYRPGVPETANPRLEEMQYRGIVTLADARQRALFDLKQVQARAAKWTFNAGAESIRSTRGDLIGVNHDFLNEFHDSGRVVDVVSDNGLITAIVVDRDMPVYNEPDMLTLTDMLAVADMLTVGAKTSLMIRQSTGFFSTHAIVGAGPREYLKLATPYPLDYDEDGRPTIRADNLAWGGASGHEYMRLIINGITYDKNMTAQIEAVAEAPELWAA